MLFTRTAKTDNSNTYEMSEEDMYYTRILDEAIENYDESDAISIEDLREELMQEYGIKL